jgi:hypothetical protein
MERKDVMSKNVAIYKGQASALEKGAAPGCKVRSGSGFCQPAGPRAPQDLPQALRHLPASPTICLPRPGLALSPVPAPLQVLVVANPANTNSLILKEHAPSIPTGELLSRLMTYRQCSSCACPRFAGRASCHRRPALALPLHPVLQRTSPA